MKALRFNVKMHVPQRILDSVWEQGQVYGRIGRALEPYGGSYEYVLLNRETALDAIAADNDFHIFERSAFSIPER